MWSDDERDSGYLNNKQTRESDIKIQSITTTYDTMTMTISHLLKFINLQNVPSKINSHYYITNSGISNPSKDNI